MTYFQQCQQLPLHYAHNRFPKMMELFAGQIGYFRKEVIYIHPLKQLQDDQKQKQKKEVFNSGYQSTNTFYV